MNPDKIEKPYKFIDLFAGIGGFRIGFEKAGCKCVFSSEWNKFSQRTYEENFGEKPEGDIREIPSENIPHHNILVAGFPCQPFSIAGVSKKKSLNRPHGFNDPTQGTLFFEIKRILKDKKPEAFLLENVKNLLWHDKGRTFKIIMRSLENELGYSVFYKIIDAKLVVPQHRERIFLVGFKKWVPYEFPEIPDKHPKLRDILEIKPEQSTLTNEIEKKYTLSDKLWAYLQKYAEKHREKGNGFGFGLADLNGISRTLSARYYKDGSEILIPQPNRNPRRLTPRECARLMGFPESFKIPVSDTQAYKQFGNAVVVPIAEYLAKSIVKTLDEEYSLME